MPVFRFAEYELDLDQAELSQAGATIALRPLLFDLLVHLLRNRHRVVSREELLREVWGVETLSASSIPTAINSLRNVLGDPAASPRLIRTVPTKGYRFAGSVEVAATERRILTVGRNDELDFLASVMDMTPARGSSVVLISGEPGIGKTHLVEEFARRALSTGLAIGFGRARRTDDEGAYVPWRNALSGWLGADRPRAARRGRLESILSLLAGVPPQEGHPDLSSPETTLTALLPALERFVGNEAGMLVLEDIDRWDAASLTLLEAISNAPPDCPLLLLATMRSAPRDTWRAKALGKIASAPRTSPLLLTGLSLDAVKTLIAARAPGCADALAADVHRRTAGNPFFVTQLYPLLLSADSRQPSKLSQRPLPTGVRAAVAARLEVLPKETRALLESASVYGTSFPLAHLHESRSGTPTLLDDLAPAVSAGLVRLSPQPVAGEFCHEIVREAIYAQIPHRQRTEAHLDIAARLETDKGDSRRISLLADHYVAAGEQSERALAAIEAAALSARDSYDTPRAAELLGCALKLGEALLAESGSRLSELETLLGEVLARLGDREHAREVLHRALASAREHDRSDLFGRAALALAPAFFPIEVGASDFEQINLLEEAIARLGPGESDLAARINARLAAALHHSGHPSAAIAPMRAAWETSDTLSSDCARAEVIAARCTVLAGPDHLQERRALAQDGLELALRGGDLETALLFRLLRTNNALEACELGDVDLEIRLFEALSSRLGSGFGRWYVLLLQAMRTLLRGDLAGAESLAFSLAAEGARVSDQNAALSLGAILGIVRSEQERIDEVLPLVSSLLDRFPALTRPIHASLASALSQAARDNEAEHHFRRAAASGIVTGVDDAFFLEVNALLGLAAARLRMTREANKIYEALLPFQGHGVVIGYSVASLGSLARVLGMLAASLKDWDRAEHHFLVALRQNQGMESPLWVGHTLFEYASMLAIRGRRGDQRRAAQLAAESRVIADTLGLASLRTMLDNLRPDGDSGLPTPA